MLNREQRLRWEASIYQYYIQISLCPLKSYLLWHSEDLHHPQITNVMKDSISQWNLCSPTRINFYSRVLVLILFFLRKTVSNPCPNNKASNFLGKSILQASIIFLSGICMPLSNQMFTLVHKYSFYTLAWVYNFPRSSFISTVFT